MNKVDGCVKEQSVTRYVRPKHRLSIRVVDGEEETNVTHFVSIDDFNAFYEAHKDEIDSTDTKKLNQMYMVENVDKHNPTIMHAYKFTREKGCLTLRRKNREKRSLARRVDSLESVVRQFIDYFNANFASMKTNSAPASFTSNMRA